MRLGRKQHQLLVHRTSILGGYISLSQFHSVSHGLRATLAYMVIPQCSQPRFIHHAEVPKLKQGEDYAICPCEDWTITRFVRFGPHDPGVWPSLGLLWVNSST